MKRTPRYTGPNKSGICVCGHSWEEHHLNVVLNEDYYKDTGEAYIPGECEAFGFNERGGMMPVYFGGGGDNVWIDHCHGYKDSMEENECYRRI